MNYQTWDCCSKLSSPFPNKVELTHDFALQVPWQNYDIVRLVSASFLRVDDWNPTPWQDFPLIERIPVRYERDHVGSNAGIVDDCVALRGSSICAHDFAGKFSFDQEYKKFIRLSINLGLKVQIVTRVEHPGLFLLFKNVRYTVAPGVDVGLRALCKDTQAAAMCGMFLHIEYGEAICGKMRRAALSDR